MAQQTIYLDEARLQRIDAAILRIRPGWDVTVTAHYFDSPGDAAVKLSRSPQNGAQAIGGELVSAECREDFHELVATVIVDTRVLLFTVPEAPTRIQQTSVARRTTFAAWDRRSALLQSLFHELGHAIQAWSAGPDNFECLSAAEQARAAAQRQRSPLSPQDGTESYPGYRLNRYEIEAEAYATRLLTQLRPVIDAGGMNDMVPYAFR